MIRKANIDDLNGIVAVWNSAIAYMASYGSTQWQSGYPNIQTGRQDLLNHHVIVCEINHEIIGVSVVCLGIEPSYLKIYDGKWLNNEPYASIHRLAVKHEYQHRGYAIQLLKASEELALEQGIHNIRVDTCDYNRDMTMLLKTNGYLACGIIKLAHPYCIDKERTAYQKNI